MGGKIEVTIRASVGTVSLDTVAAARAALNFLEGFAAGAPTLRFEAPPARINAALSTLAFRSPANYVGSADVTISARDFGFSGSGSENSATHTITVTTQPVYH